MHSSLRTKVALWFFFVVVAVGIAGYAGFRRLSDYILNEARAQMDSKLDHVIDVLTATNSTYLTLVHSSMSVLKMLCQQRGEPHLDLVVKPDGSTERILFFGNRPMAEDALVDTVKEMMGGTATIFVKGGDNFVGITTNVLKPDGSRAVGTVLDPDGPAIAAIHKGEAYYGVADILGNPYITGCEPIRNSRGETIGVFHVGYPLESFFGISEAMKDRGILRRGFFALLDHSDKIIFRTENVPNPRELETVVTRAEQKKPVDPRWIVQLRTFAPWDYDVIAALYLPDVSAETFEIIWQVYGIGSVTILGVLAVSFLLASRLSDALGQAETSRQEALEARDAAESANRTKSTFLANMSHELRTPMNAILGYSEMLIEEAEDLNIKELTPDLNKIRAAGKHLLSLINDVLDLSKIEAGKMTLFVEEINVESMIQDVATTIQPLIDKNANKLEIDIPADCGTIRADLTKIRQTLLNLLSNASKFTEKGKITLAVRRMRGEAVLASEAPTDSRTASERIQFSVRDTGIGMTHEQQGKLFKAFSQTDASTTRKYGGTGLGLVISRRFCQLMGGDIAVRSEYGKGTTFTVDLPVEIAEISSEPSPPAYALVVEDDISSRQLICRMLEKEGIRFHEAENGSAALEQIGAEIPGVILLDLMMPVMDGFEFLRILRQNPRFAGIPIVVITAKDLTAEDRERLAGSVERVIAKSAMDREQLLAEVTTALARAGPKG